MTAARGIDSGEREKIDHLEVAGDAAVAGRQSRPPAALGKVRIAIELQKPEEHLADDASADGPLVRPFAASCASLARSLAEPAGLSECHQKCSKATGSRSIRSRRSAMKTR